MNNIIEVAKEKALNKKPLSREEIIELLSIDENSEEWDLLGKAAFEVAQKVSDGKAYLWGAMGVDYKPCNMNCDFCSLGEALNLVK